MKKFLKCSAVIFVLVLIGVAIFFFFWKQTPKLIDLVPGWQEKTEIDGIVPKGAIMVISESSNLIFPGDSDSKQKTGFTKEGVIVFNQKDYCVSEGSVWIYIPEKYEVLVKLENFLPQCDEKLSELTEKENTVKDLYLN